MDGFLVNIARMKKIHAKWQIVFCPKGFARAKTDFAVFIVIQVVFQDTGRLA